MDSPKLASYYWTFIKHFGREVWRSGKAEILSSLGISFIVFLISWRLGDATAVLSFKIAVVANLCWLALFAFGHLVRTPWLLHRDAETAASHRWEWGIFGVAAGGLLVAGIVAGGLWLYSSIQPSQLPIRLWTPTDRDAEITQLKQKLAQTERNQQPRGSALFNTIQPPAPIAPQSQLDRLVEINKRLPKAEREQLAEALIGFSKILDQANNLWGKANRVDVDLDPTDFDSRKSRLREVLAVSKVYEDDFRQARQTWHYYDRQIGYTFGDNPDNDAVIVHNAAADYLNYLDWLGKLKSDEKQPILNLLGTFETNQYSPSVGRFIHWKQACDSRLQQMKDSIN